ncbi:hypothetical protein K2173_007843 [Erythroxylum novogranatense]|uniref:Integrase zinc-binding domain-containing protein n=1 Tax=Erythroxylum novogranatense TaxID=1862640 RepID=A0AAV8TIT2_9ROSI|nr:hypothetical protein K2173_007843 [Erythroxylum novogranatense]
MGQRLCVPDVGDLRREILEEAHMAAYAMHPGTTKMYNTLKLHFWWPGMKRQVAEYHSDPTHVIPAQEIELASNLSYVEEPIQIVGSRVKQLRSRVIPLVKVLWKNHSTKEATWETEEHMRRQ